MQGSQPIWKTALISALIWGAGNGYAQETVAEPEVTVAPETAEDLTAERATQTGASEATAPNAPRAILPILVFDRNRALSESKAGLALKAELDAARVVLLQENDDIYQELEAEERALSEQREAMSDDDFRAAAQAFDEKVTQVRETQDEKSREVQALYDTNLQELEAKMNTALAQTARQTGAIVVFERGQVYMMSGAIDVTDELIKRLDLAEDTAQAAQTPAEATTAGDDPASGGSQDGGTTETPTADN